MIIEQKKKLILNFFFLKHYLQVLKLYYSFSKKQVSDISENYLFSIQTYVNKKIINV